MNPRGGARGVVPPLAPRDAASRRRTVRPRLRPGRRDPRRAGQPARRERLRPRSHVDVRPSTNQCIATSSGHSSSLLFLLLSFVSVQSPDATPPPTSPPTHIRPGRWTLCLDEHTSLVVTPHASSRRSQVRPHRARRQRARRARWRRARRRARRRRARRRADALRLRARGRRLLPSGECARS